MSIELNAEKMLSYANTCENELSGLENKLIELKKAVDEFSNSEIQDNVSEDVNKLITEIRTNIDGIRKVLEERTINIHKAQEILTDIETKGVH